MGFSSRNISTLSLTLAVMDTPCAIHYPGTLCLDHRQHAHDLSQKSPYDPEDAIVQDLLAGQVQSVSVPCQGPRKCGCEWENTCHLKFGHWNQATGTLQVTDATGNYFSVPLDEVVAYNDLEGEEEVHDEKVVANNLEEA